MANDYLRRFVHWRKKKVDLHSGKKEQNWYWKRCIGESPSICPFLKNNGHEAPKGPSAIIFQEWTDTSTFSSLKYTLIYNYV